MTKRPLLIWPSRLSMQSVTVDLHKPADAFTFVRPDVSWSWHLLRGHPKRTIILDPHDACTPLFLDIIRVNDYHLITGVLACREWVKEPTMSRYEYSVTWRDKEGNAHESEHHATAIVAIRIAQEAAMRNEADVYIKVTAFNLG